VEYIVRRAERPLLNKSESIEFNKVKKKKISTRLHWTSEFGAVTLHFDNKLTKPEIYNSVDN